MSDFNTTKQDAARAERIRRQYLSREANKIEQLKRLDDKVKIPGKAAASLLGAAGALVMGAGMSYVMVWNNMTTGLILGIPGLAAALLAWPLYRAITGVRSKRFSDEILRLSDELITTQGGAGV